MKRVGLFEAKAKLSELCAKVAQGKQGIVITCRGQPWVKLEPLPEASASIWDRRREFVRKRGKLPRDLAIPKRTSLPFKNPLDG